MNPKSISFKQQSLPSPQHKPSILKLTNLTNQPESTELHSLKLRIDELQRKIGELQSKIRTKRKRIRRKSNEVQKKHICDYCKKMYGSMVSLNLHLRIKHKQERISKKEELKDKPKEESELQE